MKDLVSIIIPVYNVEKYLNRCIDSVIKQTYTNLEIILVDDESPDNCGKICDDYASRDKRIKVIHKKNGGISYARNEGLDNVTGKYIYFVDSDDYIFDYTIEYLYNLIIANNADIAIGQDRLIYENENIINNEGICYKEKSEKLYTSEEAIKSTLYNYGISSSAWNKLYKTELFNNIRYPFGRICEDLATTYKLFHKSNKIIVGYRTTYNYLTNRYNSYMNAKFKKERMDGIYFCKEIIEFTQQEYPQLRDAAIYRLIIECIFILLKLPKKTEYKKENKEILYYLKKYRFSVIKNKKVTKSSKIMCITSYFGRIPLRIMWNIKENIKRKK